MTKFLTIVVLATIALASTNAQTEKAQQVAQIQKEITNLQKATGDAFLTIEEKGGDAIVQIANGKKTLSLNIAYYPSKEKPDVAFPKVGIAIPKTWKQVDFEAEEFVAFDIPATEAKNLPLFIHNIYTKFFKRKPGYKLECYIEKF